MRGKLAILLGVAVFVTGLLSWSAPAMADQVTTLASFNDPRTAMPARPGHTIKRIRYGQSTTQNFVLAGGNAIHNAIRFDAPAPCTNCVITDMVPNLVYMGDANHTDGTTANLDTDSLMHHFVIINGSKPDQVCPGGLQGQLGERFFASGNERSQLHLPSPYGYNNGANSTWRLISHVVNKGAVQKSFNIEITYQYRTTNTSNSDAKPLWLDIDGCGDSDYTTPVGYADTTADWVSNVSGRMIGMAGHMHDLDITNSAPCTNHCPEKGHGIALSAEVVGGSNSTYFGPIPPNNTPPATLTGATMCRSEAEYGTPWAGTRFRGHLDTMSQCGVRADALLPTAQAEAWPSGGEYPSTGVPFTSGQTLRLHSEYQNDTGEPQIDVMGIMISYYVPQSAGYPRPKGATPLRASLVPAYNVCTSPNRLHGPPDFPGNASNPDGSCAPPTQTSTQVTVGTPDSAGGGAANFVGSVKVDAIAGNVATVADEADARYTISLVDIRAKTAGSPDYTGNLQAEFGLRATDKNNGPAETGTVQDQTLSVTIPCAATGVTTIGSTCAVTTTADAVSPGIVKESMRSIWQLGQIRVNDGGSDGNVATTPNGLFAVQGLFVP
jgi:hypothetical protein